ncbi:MAG: sulfatase-like hydrolase/transferase, partial [Flavobacteriales bacterium]|nr:sulfatase-like hydrolase/transferase [Flavobacteriales bacterium]
HDLSSKGSELYETPNIDALSKQGVDFSNAYVSHPRCLPSRFGLQTSNYPGAHGIPGKGNAGEAMNDGRTIGQVFKDNGYETYFAGKWHLGKTVEAWPQNRGYDINIAGCHAGAPISYFFPYNVSKSGKNKKDGHGDIVGLDEGKPGEYITDRLTDETISFFKKDHDKPFFAILNHYGVHTPLEAPKEMVNKYKQKLKGMKFEGPEFMNKDGQTKQHQDNAVYAAMIESVDNSLGKLIQTLKDEGLYENTIIVFSSDHGGLSNRGIGNNRTIATSNLPLRAGKGHIYEGGIKVPFMIGGAITSKSHICNEITSNVDLMPTLVDLCNLEQPKYKVDGISVASFIDNNETTERTLFWHAPRA